MKTKIKFLFISMFLLLLQTNAQNLSGVKICVNPGHGGYDSDDRNMIIAPYAQGDPNGFWESQSNLDKGKQLRDMLVAAGATVIITRATNTTADDLNLSVIVAIANQNNADFMVAIHSNAGSGVANSVLQLYAGKELSDATVYATATPWSDKSREISTVIAKNQYANQITTWSSGYSVQGDKTFGRIAMGWSDGYGVLRGLTVPGVISEGMMHDYIPETYRLMNMEYKWLEAWNFFKSFSNYFKPTEIIPNGVIAGSVRDSRNLNTATYYKLKGKDELLALNGAKLTVLETGTSYTADQLNNGVYVFKNLAPGIYNVKAEAVGYYPQTGTITVTAGNISYFNFNLNKVRNTPPQVVSYTPKVAITDSVECSTSIVLNFNWDMDVESTSAAFSISPAVPGTITFEDSQYRLRFTPTKPLEKTTLYTVKLAKTAKHPDNLSMADDFTFQFKTKGRNRLELLTSYPYQGDKGVYTKPLFRFVFDKALNTANLLTAIKVFDKNGLELVKNSRSFLNNSVSAPYGSCYFELTNALNPNEDYKAVISSGLVDQVGVSVVEPIEINFHTSPVLVTTQPLADGFESTGLYSYDIAQSSQVNSATVTTNSTKKLFGNYSNQFSYSFANGPATVTYKALTPTVTVNRNKVLGMHIYGDLSGNELQLQFTSGADVRYVKLCDINFFGWEFVETRLLSLAELSDYQLTGFKVTRNDGVLSGNGDMYFDNMLLYDTPLMSVWNLMKDKIKIYPNPVSDMLYVTVDNDEIPTLQLYAINGILLKEFKAKEMNVRDIAVGTYILKIKLKDSFGSYPVMIS
ncbi:MAG: Ig-like domain-containing protein, partial [Paludibacter sp.]